MRSRYLDSTTHYWERKVYDVADTACIPSFFGLSPFWVNWLSTFGLSHVIKKNFSSISPSVL